MCIDDNLYMYSENVLTNTCRLLLFDTHPSPHCEVTRTVVLSSVPLMTRPWLLLLFSAYAVSIIIMC